MTGVQLILDGLPLLETVEGGPFHHRMMEENVAAVAGNESETPVRNNPGNDTLRHDNNTSHRQAGPARRNNQDDRSTRVIAPNGNTCHSGRTVNCSP